MQPVSYDDVKAATDRVAGLVRPVTVVPPAGGAQDPQVWLALEYMQYTGSFKARGAQNFITAHRAAGTLPAAGVCIASGGNAGLACAWAAQQQGLPATVFLPRTAPALKVRKLSGYGARLRQVGTQYAEALEACEEFAAETGALAAHAYADPYVSAGAGTLMEEIHERIPDLDTVVVAVGGGGLFAGVAASARHHGVRTVAVEPENCRALNAAWEAGRPVDVGVDSIAADSLGARCTWPGALAAVQHASAVSVLVGDEQITAARRLLWDERRIVVEHGASTALAALLGNGDAARGYRPRPGEKVAVVLCGANTDPGDLVAPDTAG
ncbi:threonine dehydratase [Actinacidiphila yanglinensis]|uniref:Threonine dehydratase n=1 Tax=Actinacidiphila yanglinensis TaxID=310779 RepID=A0A1H6EDI9_9ACTN|nr:serine/threonine dehydratase [Actinacidiphila yanglinensis]SEG95888.1 threonine dehydratase [Actinacidiphila yanglinensis]